MDKAGKDYWDNSWTAKKIPSSAKPDKKGLENYITKVFHRYFIKSLEGIETKDKRLLEIGCARSIWLPYFSKEFGFKIEGIDYSENGCEQSREILVNEGVEGNITCSDFFNPPKDMLGKYDVVVSFGVAEHFEDTAKCIKAFSEFLKPGGIIITEIPNLAGLMGTIQKKVGPLIYNIHVPLDRFDLVNAHKINSLEILNSDYLMFLNLGILIIDKWKEKYYYKFLLRLISWISKLFLILEKTIPIFKPNRYSSPYIICSAKKL